MRRVLVSSFLADVTQHIHSLRASGVMLAQTSVTVASDSIALRKSDGILCTVPEAIGCRAMAPKCSPPFFPAAGCGPAAVSGTTARQRPLAARFSRFAARFSSKVFAGFFFVCFF
jgi:hypothetical protein